MYNYLDRPIASLDTGAQFTLWAIRHGAAAIGGRRCLGAALGPCFGRYHAESALPHFAIAISTLIAEAKTPLEIMAPGNATVAEHEAVLLAAFMTVDDPADHVGATIGLMMQNEGAAVTAARAIRMVTAHMLAAGIPIATPDPAAGR